MAIADLHVHSLYSDHPSEWFLQKLGTRESYSEPEFIYEQAVNAGMSFVTITDHNNMDGVLKLKEKFPQRVFTGVETTTYFPEDKCKIHVLIFGLNESQFAEIERIRSNIYDLRSYIFEQNLAYSVAHATYSINKKLTYTHLEKLVLLFDVFEGINGSRDQKSNTVWTNFLECLTPDLIDNVYNKHRIEPASADPWMKGFTGGSDDHSGFFIGRTYSVCDAFNPEEFVQKIREKRTVAAGRTGNYQSLVFSVYKIAYDFSKGKTKKEISPFSMLSESLAGNDSVMINTQLILHKLSIKKNKGDVITENFIQLLRELSKMKHSAVENKMQLVYDTLGEISDHFFKTTFEKIKSDLAEGDIIDMVNNVSSALPWTFLMVPFFSALGHMHQNRHILDELQRKNNRNRTGKKILLFTDTISDLNGVSETVKKLGWLAHEKNIQLKIVYCNDKASESETLPPNVIRLPSIESYNPSFYDTYTMHFPSVLKSLQMISEESPDEVIISTPGIIGLLGLLSARLLNIKSTGVYHTDFTSQVTEIIGDEMVSDLVESYMHWFYNMVDHILVPTMEYMSILGGRGYDIRKMSLLRRGVEKEFFCQPFNKKAILKFGISDGNTLLYTGRISKDKNIDFLINIYRKVIEKHPDTCLLIVGDGPYLDEVKKNNKDLNGLVFAGRLERKMLPEIYAASELFIFPSDTDTFGMSVMEAQAAGLPAIVSNKGGPKEIIVQNYTGYAMSTGKLELWVNKTNEILDLISMHPDKYLEMRFRIGVHTQRAFDWNNTLIDLIYKNSKIATSV